MGVTLRKRFAAYTDPLGLLYIFVVAFLRAAFRAILTFDWATLISPRRLRHVAFADGFLAERAGFKAFEDTTAVPALTAACRGVVLELGPGIGNQCHRFDVTRIDRIVGVEPNAAMVPALRDATTRAGLADCYTIANCGVEDAAGMARAGLVPASVDCVLAIQVLCSVPEPSVVAQQLYRLLKPGGELIFFEHVAAEDSADRLVQTVYNPVWQFALDGCSLDRPTLDYLLAAGEWTSVAIERDPPGTSLFPRVWGRLVKASEKAPAED